MQVDGCIQLHQFINAFLKAIDEIHLVCGSICIKRDHWGSTLLVLELNSKVELVSSKCKNSDFSKCHPRSEVVSDISLSLRFAHNQDVVEEEDTPLMQFAFFAKDVVNL